MLRPTHIDFIVARTLQGMGIFEPSIEKLIKGTFAAESNLEVLFDYSNGMNPKHGLMLLEEAKIKETISEYLKYNRILSKKIFDSTGIDVVNEDIDVLVSECDSNIAFMVCILYTFYLRNYESMPQDDLKEIAKCYRAHFKQTAKIEAEESFIDKYRKTFTRS